MPIVKLYQHKIMYNDLIKTDEHHELCSFWSLEEGDCDPDALLNYDDRNKLLKLIMTGRYIWIVSTGQVIEDEI